MRIQAGNANATERENMKAVWAERHKETSGSTETLHSLTKAAQKETEKAKIYVGEEVSQIQPNKNKWKRQARATKNEGGASLGLGTHKRPNNEVAWLSLKLKKTKVAGPSKSETKKYFSTATKTNLYWEPLVIEEMELTTLNIEEISAEASTQPRRKA